MVAMSDIEANDIYEVIRIVGKDWLKFARKCLGLSEIEIEACEHYNPRDLEEHRYQMVQTWMRKEGRCATTAKLYQLVDQLRVGNEVQGASNQRYGDGPSPGKASKIPSMPEGDVSGTLMNKCSLDERPASRKSSSVNETPVKESASAPRYDFSSKAFSKSHKRSESGATISSSESDHISSSESIRSRKKSKKNPIKQFTAWAMGKNSKTKKPEPKSTDYCTAVHRNEVATMTEEDMRKVLGTTNRYETEKHNGCALIINNSFPNVKNMERHGSEKDVKHMVKLWRQIGCDIYNNEPYLEQKADQMRQILKDMSNPKKEYSYIVIVIMSHGELVEDKVFFKGADHERVSVDEIEQAFNNVKAPRLSNIPKLFILQFCCGGKKDRGVDFDNAITERISSDDTPPAKNGNVHLDGAKIPTYSDMLFVYSTHKRYVSIRDPENGSWFITALTNVVMEFSRSETVGEMLLRVNDAMKNKSGRYEETDEKTGTVVSYNICAMSYSRNCFTKKLFLLPGYHRKK